MKPHEYHQDLPGLARPAALGASDLNHREGQSAATALPYDFERILDLVDRINDCDRQIRPALSEGRDGGLRALGLAGQIAADAQELRALLQTRNEDMA